MEGTNRTGNRTVDSVEHRYLFQNSQGVLNLATQNNRDLWPFRRDGRIFVS
jgi:hypothetical protein